MGERLYSILNGKPHNKLLAGSPHCDERADPD